MNRGGVNPGVGAGLKKTVVGNQCYIEVSS